MSSFSKKLKKNKDTVRKIILFIIAVMVVLAAITVIERLDSGTGEVVDSEEDGRAMLYYNGQWYVEREDIYKVAVMGIDKYLEDIADLAEDAYVNTQQADFITVLIMDKTAKRYDILQINRDTITDVRELGLNSEVTDVKQEQIALAHTYGTGGNDSCRNAVKAISNLLYSTTIDNYVAFTMDAVPIVNDAADGVTVLIEDDFSGVDETLIQGQEITLMGDHALNYLRARGGMSDSTNVARMGRHRTYLDALLKAAEKKTEESSSWASTTALSVADYIVTDMSTKSLSGLADTLVDYEQGDILTIKGETQTNVSSLDGQKHVEFYPDEDALKAQIVELFYEPTDRVGETD